MRQKVRPSDCAIGPYWKTAERNKRFNDEITTTEYQNSCKEKRNVRQNEPKNGPKSRKGEINQHCHETACCGITNSYVPQDCFHITWEVSIPRRCMNPCV